MNLLSHSLSGLMNLIFPSAEIFNTIIQGVGLQKITIEVLRAPHIETLMALIATNEDCCQINKMHFIQINVPITSKIHSKNVG